MEEGGEERRGGSRGEEERSGERTGWICVPFGCRDAGVGGAGVVQGATVSAQLPDLAAYVPCTLARAHTQRRTQPWRAMPAAHIVSVCVHVRVHVSVSSVRVHVHIQRCAPKRTHGHARACALPARSPGGMRACRDLMHTRVSVPDERRTRALFLAGRPWGLLELEQVVFLLLELEQQ